MARTVGKLVAIMSARTKPFERGLQRAEKGVVGFSRKIQMPVKSLGAMGAAIGSVLAVGGLTSFVSRTIEAIDTQTKFAGRLGMSVEKLTALHHAATLTGVSAETFNMSMQRLVRNVGDAARGVGEARESLKFFGLDAAEMAGLAPDEMFLRLADAMGNVSNQSQALSHLVKLVDSEGAALVNTLGLGRDELERIMAEAQRLGLTVSDIDAQQIAATNDALARAGGALSALGRQLTIELAPFIEAFADMFVESMNEGEGAVAKLGKAFGWLEPVTKFVLFLADAQSLVTNLTLGLIKGVVGLGSVITAALIAPIEYLVNLIPGVETDVSGFLASFGVDTLKSAGENFRNIGETVSGTGSMLKSFNDKMADLRKRAEENAGALNGQANATRDLQAALDAANAEAARFAELQKFAERVIEDTRTPLERYNMQVEKLDEALAAGLLTAEQYARAIAKAKAELDGAASAADDLDQELKSFADGVKRDVMTPLERFEEQMKKLQEAFEKGLIDEETFRRAVKMAEDELARLQERQAEVAGEAADDDPGRARQVEDFRRLAFGQSGGKSRLEELNEMIVESMKAVLHRLDEPLPAEVRL